MKSYSELILLPTFLERYEYLRLQSSVGQPTFGFERYLNQMLYTSWRWRNIVRRDIIARDVGCDLGVEGHEIYDKIVIHHINPITIENVERNDFCVWDYDNLICTSDRTHKAIHYGSKDQLAILPSERRKGDTTPWTTAY